MSYIAVRLIFFRALILFQLIQLYFNEKHKNIFNILPSGRLKKSTGFNRYLFHNREGVSDTFVRISWHNYWHNITAGIVA